MKQLRLFIFMTLIFTSITAVAKDCPFMRQDKIYNCSLIILDEKKSSYSAFLTMTKIKGKDSIVIKGNDDDDSINFVITLNSGLTSKSNENGIYYVRLDDNDNGVLVGNWTEGRRLILFTFEGLNIGVVYDPYPIGDINDYLN